MLDSPVLSLPIFLVTFQGLIKRGMTYHVAKKRNNFLHWFPSNCLEKVPETVKEVKMRLKMIYFVPGCY